MTTNFTASNGLVITPHQDGSVRWETGSRPTVVAAALREFFQRERDEELGRVRWPEDPDYVIYLPDEDGDIYVMAESAPSDGFHVSRKWAETSGPHGMAWARAAAWYFENHPPRKPWHDARHHELWLLTIQGCQPEVYIYRDGDHAWAGAFRPVANEDRVSFKPTDPLITDAHRIWPEATDA